MSSISESESPDRSGRDPTPLLAVLAARDLSDTADAALVSAATVGDAVGGKVHVVHCVKRPGPFGWWDEAGEPERLADAEATLREQVDRACGAGRQPSSTVVTSGRPAAEINGRARAVGADLIVVGPGRRRFSGATRLGSTADRVIRTSRVPCLLTHDRPKPARSPGRLLDAEVARIVERVGRGQVAVEPVIYSAPLVVEGVQQVAEERDADLVVVGTHGYNPLSRMLVGSVATAVAGSLDRAILVVPPEPTPEDAEIS
jgi:nucleotide-binding universal stress UspA family protein